MRCHLLIITILLSSCGASSPAVTYLYVVLASASGKGNQSPPKVTAKSSGNKYFDENCKQNECPEVDLSLVPATGLADGQQFFEGTVNELVDWTMKFKSPIKRDRVIFAIKENPKWMHPSVRWSDGILRVFGKPDTTTENTAVKILVRDFSRCFAQDKQNFNLCKDLSREFPGYDKMFSMTFKIKANPNWPSP